MATTLFKVSRASSDVGSPKVAAAPSGGTYLAAGQGTSGPGTKAYLARINSDGSVNWQKEINLAGTPVVSSYIVSSTTHVALALTYTDPDSSIPSISVQLYNSSGTLVWHKAYEFVISTNDAFLIHPTGTDVYLIGQLEGAFETVLLKLDGTTGNEAWAVNLRGTAESDTVDGSGPITMLSGGDLVLFTIGPVHTDATAQAYVQRCSASDGSVVWSRSVAWPASGQSYTGIALDTSDNIYLWGPEFVQPTYKQLPVVKLDSSGAVVWNRQLEVPAGLQSRSLGFARGGRGVGGTDGVLIPAGFGIDASDTLARRGFVNVASAGTVGTAVANLATFNSVTSTASSPHSNGGTGQQILLAYGDLSTDEAAIVALGGYASSEDASFGPYTRTTFAYDLEAGGATVATASFTRASAVSPATATARTITDASGSLVVTTYSAGAPSQTGAATGIASTLAFGSGYVFGLVTGIAPATAFGAVNGIAAQPAAGIASTLAFGVGRVLSRFAATAVDPSFAFGLPAVNLNLAYPTTGIAPTTAIGEIWAWPGTSPPPRSVSGVPSALVFGTAAALQTAACAASGFQTTAFGEPRSGYGLGATGSAASTAFGLPTLLLPQAASGFTSTLFGTPQTWAGGFPSGFSTAVRFGLPAVNFGTTQAASGWASTAYGTPAALAAYQRTRGARFRTAFGAAQTERTAP